MSFLHDFSRSRRGISQLPSQDLSQDTQSAIGIAIEIIWQNGIISKVALV
jgi:hypothetical protein